MVEKKRSPQDTLGSQCKPQRVVFVEFFVAISNQFDREQDWYNLKRERKAMREGERVEEMN